MSRPRLFSGASLGMAAALILASTGVVTGAPAAFSRDHQGQRERDPLDPRGAAAPHLTRRRRRRLRGAAKAARNVGKHNVGVWARTWVQAVYKRTNDVISEAALRELFTMDADDALDSGPHQVCAGAWVADPGEPRMWRFYADPDCIDDGEAGAA